MTRALVLNAGSSSRKWSVLDAATEAVAVQGTESWAEQDPLRHALSQFADALTPGVVLGARVPVALTSRADPPTARLAACAIAELLASKHAVVM
jgi:hypothetical protein